jgi:hypothetical protein
MVVLKFPHPICLDGDCQNEATHELLYPRGDNTWGAYCFHCTKAWDPKAVRVRKLTESKRAMHFYLQAQPFGRLRMDPENDG